MSEQDVGMSQEAAGQSLYERVVAATPHGDALIRCMQCGTCSGSCPAGTDMDLGPRQLFTMLRANMEDQVLSSNTPWYCVSCYFCTVRCPQEVPVASLMYTLKRMAIRKGHYHKDNHAEWSKSFVSFIDRYGRTFEIGLMARHYLTQKPLKGVRQSGLGVNMLRKGRLNLVPERIRNMQQLTSILNEARRIAAEEGVL